MSHSDYAKSEKAFSPQENNVAKQFVPHLATQYPKPKARTSCLASFGVALGAIATSICLAAAILAPILVLMIYTFVWHQATISGRYIFSGASSVKVLTITGVINTVAEHTIVPALGLVTCVTASRWWQSSQEAKATSQTPTGVQ